MAHPRQDLCGCFPTGVPYAGIAELLLRAPVAQLGMAEDLPVDVPWIQVPLAVIDTETTGKDPARGDRIVEIAVVYFDHGKVTERHAMLVNPGMPIPREASAVHGIDDDKVRDQPTFADIAPRLVKILHGRVPVAYNAGFDRGFIYAELRRAGINPGRSHELPPALRTTTDWIDPLVWARALQSTARGFKLVEVSARLNISIAHAHRATDDAEATGEVLVALLAPEHGLTYRTLVSRQRAYVQDQASRAPWRR